jgi:hypothetical protein
MRVAKFLLAVLALLAVVSVATDPERQLKLKTSRQLKEILAAADVKPPKGNVPKAKLVKLALKHDALAKWEAANPEKAYKRPRGAAAAGGGGGGGGGGGMPSMAEMEQHISRMFGEKDANRDGKISFAEFADDGAAPESVEGDHIFNSIDANRDGAITRDEMKKFMIEMTRQQGSGGVPGGGYAQRGEPMPEVPDTPDVIDDPDDEVEDGNLPSHSEL